MTRAALAQATNRSVESIRLYERDQINAVPGEFLRAVAALLGQDFGFRRLRLLPDVGDVADTATMRQLVDGGESMSRASVENVVPSSKVRVAAIPLFDLPLAAGGWNEVPEAARLSDKGFEQRGRFRVRLSGDSMMDLFADGQIVEFEYVLGTEFGRDYYVQLLDGGATFKRLVKIERDETVVLAALNPKYPKPLRVPAKLVAHYALAVAKIDLLGSGRTVRKAVRS